ncbi:reverse transcriptase domain-containing protein [Tanacetum coccineum]
MLTTRQQRGSGKIEQIVAQRVTNSIETIAIYETKIRVAHDSIVRVVRQGAKVARNANNKMKWKGGYQNNTAQQSKRQRVVRAYTAEPGNNNGYVGKLPLCNKCKLHHTGPCTIKCNNCKRVGHMTRNCRTPVTPTTLRPLVEIQKATVTCYEYGKKGDYKNECSKLKNLNFGNQKGNKGKACENPNVIIDHANA